MSFLETSDGVRLRYTDRGDGPRPIVLVHGWKGSHRLWDQAVERLAAGHRVVAFDLRGMGESDKPRASYSFEELSADLGHVLHTLNLQDVTLVGWSMGCTISLHYLDTRGERVGRLVLVNGPLRLTQAPDFPHAMSPAELDGHIGRLRDGWPAGERAFQAETVLAPTPALVDWLYSIALQTPLEIALRVVRHQAGMDMRDAVGRLAVPVLAVYSRHDPYYPASLADDIATRAPDGRSVIFDRSAHCIPLEEPDRFCAVVSSFSARGEGAGA